MSESHDEPEVAYDEIVRRTHAVLKPLGFKKRGTTFARVKGVSTQRLAFQKSAWRSAGEPISFTLNLHLFVHELAPEVDPAKPPIDHFHYQERIGSLLPAEIDRWWDVADASDVDVVWQELSAALSGPVQRWAEQATTTEGLSGSTPESQGLMLVDLVAWRKQSFG